MSNILPKKPDKLMGTRRLKVDVRAFAQLVQSDGRIKSSSPSVVQYSYKLSFKEHRSSMKLLLPRARLAYAKYLLDPRGQIIFRARFSTSNARRSLDPDPRFKDLGRVIKDEYANIRSKYGKYLQPHIVSAIH